MINPTQQAIIDAHLNGTCTPPRARSCDCTTRYAKAAFGPNIEAIPAPEPEPRSPLDCAAEAAFLVYTRTDYPNSTLAWADLHPSAQHAWIDVATATVRAFRLAVTDNATPKES